jgi:hypothetical protein
LEFEALNNQLWVLRYDELYRILSGVFIELSEVSYAHKSLLVIFNLSNYAKKKKNLKW